MENVTLDAEQSLIRLEHLTRSLLKILNLCPRIEGINSTELSVLPEDHVTITITTKVGGARTLRHLRPKEIAQLKLPEGKTYWTSSTTTQALADLINADALENKGTL